MKIPDWLAIVLSSFVIAFGVVFLIILLGNFATDLHIENYKEMKSITPQPIDCREALS